MGYENATLNVENKEVIFIKPSNPTPTTVLSLSSIDNVPYNNYLSQTLHVYQSSSHNSPDITKLDPANVIKEALSKALFYYYPLAGKLVRHEDGKFRINCTSEGVPFIEAFCNCNLSSLNYLDGNDVEIAKHFGVEYFPSQDDFGNQYPLVFKVTKFLCGGFIFVVGWCHVVCDGAGISQFLRAVAELASGKTEPSLKPVWERERLVGTITTQPMQNPINMASVAVSPFRPCKDFSHECSKVESESITRLKRSLMNEEESNDTKKKGFTFTSFESLAAYIWRSKAKALKLNYDGETMLRIIVGVRPRLLDPLPHGYYGNAIVDANVKLTVKELNERPLSEVVKLIKESIAAFNNDDYMRNSIDSLETKPIKYNYESGAIMILTDWRHLGLLENVDFGWNEPVNTMPVPWDMFGYAGSTMILPPSNMDSSMKKGGARVYVSLPRDAMPKFNEEMKALARVQIAKDYCNMV